MFFDKIELDIVVVDFVDFGGVHVVCLCMWRGKLLSYYS